MLKKKNFFEDTCSEQILSILPCCWTILQFFPSLLCSLTSKCSSFSSFKFSSVCYVLNCESVASMKTPSPSGNLFKHFHKKEFFSLTGILRSVVKIIVLFSWLQANGRKIREQNSWDS